jgi:hypothetical protein
MELYIYRLNPYQNTTLIPGDFNKLERILDIRDNVMISVILGHG